MPAVLVTGAGRGFGRALLEEYLGRGWTVLPLVRDPGTAGALAAIPRTHPIVADVGEAGVEQAVARALAAADLALDLLVNNAGQIRKLRGLAATTAEDLEALFRVHCVGALRCTRAALPWLQCARQAAHHCMAWAHCPD